MKLNLRQIITIAATSLLLTACGDNEVIFEKIAFGNNNAEFFENKDITRTIYHISNDDTDETIKLLTNYLDDEQASDIIIHLVSARDIEEIKDFDMPLSFDIPEAKILRDEKKKLIDIIAAEVDKTGNWRKVNVNNYRQNFIDAYLAYKKASLISILGNGEKTDYVYNRITASGENFAVIIDTYEGDDTVKGFSDYSTINMYLATREGVQDNIEEKGYEYTPRGAGFYISTSLGNVFNLLRSELQRNIKERERLEK
ncbi:hypothetical protein [Shewanella ulleungensis]|uniref:hypothetical protein n=1 Tax=Shewanella ulleungensis TaxID=2282699 RepID=UPI003D7A0A03